MDISARLRACLLPFLAAVLLMLGAGAFLASRPAPSGDVPQEQAVAEGAVREASILFVGDIMLDRYIRRKLETLGPEHVLGGVAELLAAQDLVAGNLEGPVTDERSVSRDTTAGHPANMRFTFSPDTPGILRAYGFGLVSLNNNHILDFGASGALATERYLEAAGIAHVGSLSGDEEPLLRDVNGVRIAFVSYSDFRGGDAERALAAVRAAEGADAVVVLAHWGEEYEVEPGTRVRSLARAMADAGADLIIGTHSHIIGEREDWNGTRIYYSLGNFVFDQYFRPETKCGLAVIAHMESREGGTSLRFEETQVGMLPDGRTVLGCDA